MLPEKAIKMIKSVGGVPVLAHPVLYHMGNEQNLLISGGSDYHGANKPDIELGTGRGHLFVPEEILTKIKEYKNNI